MGKILGEILQFLTHLYRESDDLLEAERTISLKNVLYPSKKITHPGRIHSFHVERHSISGFPDAKSTHKVERHRPHTNQWNTTDILAIDCAI